MLWLKDLFPTLYIICAVIRSTKSLNLRIFNIIKSGFDGSFLQNIYWMSVCSIGGFPQFHTVQNRSIMEQYKVNNDV